MGLFKKLKKGIKNITKGIAKVVTKIPIAGKVIKKLSKSTLGKVVLFAAAVYLTGGLAAGSFAPGAVFGQLGTWGGSLGSTLTGSAGTAGTVGSTAAAGSAGGVSAGLGLSAEALAATSGTIGSVATGAGTAATAAGAAGVGTAAAGAGIGSSIGSGLLGTAKAVGAFAEKNQLLSAALVKGGAKAIEVMNTPSAEEEAAGVLRARQQANELPADFASRLNPLNPIPTTTNSFTTAGMIRQAQGANTPPPVAPTAQQPQQIGTANPAVYGMTQQQYDEQIARINQFAPLPA